MWDLTTSVSTRSTLETLAQRGMTISANHFFVTYAPLLKQAGLAVKMGEARSAALVLHPKAATILHKYLQWRKDAGFSHGSPHNAVILKEFAKAEGVL